MATIISSKTSGVGGLSVTGDASGVLQLASSDGTTALTINASQNVGIGTALPLGKLQVSGATAPLTGGYGQLNIFSTDAIGADKGGKISFGGVSGASGFDPYGFCSIAGYKENATASNFLGYLQFSTANSGGTVIERMRIDSAGKVGINVTPVAGTNAKMQITGLATNATTLATAYSDASLVVVPKSTSGYSLAIASGTSDSPQLQVSANGAASGDLLIQPYGGNVGIGATSNLASSKLDVRGRIRIGSGNSSGDTELVFSNYASATSAWNVAVRQDVGGANNDLKFLRFDSAGNYQAIAMQISSAGGIVSMPAYGAGAATFSAAGVISSVSDETWKIKDGIPVNPDEMIQKLKPGYWFYNDEKKEIFGTDRQLGFYAQNVNEAIGIEAAPVPEEGKPWGYYDRSVLAVTVMSLQKALTTIEALTARLTALEAK